MPEEDEDRPLAELTEEGEKVLEEMNAEIKRAEEDLAAVEELGVDTSRLKERVNFAKRARDVVLKRLSRSKKE